MEEIEVKFLSIDVPQLEKKLQSIGAQKAFEKTYRRKVFDYPDLRLNEQSAWIRLRDEGDTITVAYKQRLNPTSHDGTANDRGMEEVEFTVNDFQKAALFFEKIGLALKFYEENRRIRYTLGTTHFDIDFWPQLDPYLEIEAPTWADIDVAIALLQLNPDEKKIFSTYQVYQLKGINPLDYIENTFAGMKKREQT